MSFFSRLFHAHDGVKSVEKPDDTHIQRRLEAAKRANSRAVNQFVETAHKQERDAMFARQVICELLERADKLKATDNADHKK